MQNKHSENIIPIIRWQGAINETRKIWKYYSRKAAKTQRREEEAERQRKEDNGKRIFFPLSSLCALAALRGHTSAAMPLVLG
jgi:hypothetical protein